MNCLREYSVKGFPHGDIQPHNIFVIEDCEISKKIKLLDSSMLNEAESGYQRMRNDSEYVSPLSPQAMSCLSHRDSKPTYDKSKNDIWSAAITMLCILFNEEVDRYYDLRQHKVKRDLIRSRLNTLLNVVSFSKPFV